MVLIQNWGDLFTSSLQGIWYGVASFVPNLIIAVIIFAIGWVVASLIEKIVEGLFKTLKVDHALKAAGLEEVVKHSGYSLNSGLFVGSLIKWFVIVVFLVASFNALNLTQVNLFLAQVVLTYLPQVIISVLILMVAVVIADAMKKVVVGSARAAHIKSANFLGTVTKWAIWIFAIIAALFQLGIGVQILNTLLTGIVAAISIAVGLAFGLGGKEVASEILENTKNDIETKE